MSKRVAILGNCQVNGMANCLRAIDPDLKLKAYHMARYRSDAAQKKAMEELAGVDCIFSQPLNDGAYGDLRAAELTNRFPNVLLYPSLIFHGFHPDAIFMPQNGRSVPAPCGIYHSAIVVAAFLNSVPRQRVARLFNAYVFSRLGYLQHFETWKKYFLTRAGEIGFDLSADIDAWLADGVFMHTGNHPAVRVIASVAAKLYRNWTTSEPAVPSGVRDVLSRAEKVPVYADIARTIGVKPVTCFESKIDRATGKRRSIDLDEFIFDSFALYESSSPAVFKSARVKRAVEFLQEEFVA